MSRRDWKVWDADTAALSGTDLREVRRLMDAAFGVDFSADDWNHTLGGRHFLVRMPCGGFKCHASVVSRTVRASGHLLATGYVEAVATEPGYRGRGLATATMHAAAAFIESRFELGALSSGIPEFYRKLGWIRWRGPTWYSDAECLTRTVDDDGGVLVLRTRSSPPLDPEGDIAVEWRSGDVW